MPAGKQRPKMTLPELHPNKEVRKFASRQGKVALRIDKRRYFFPLKNKHGLLQGIGRLPDDRIIALRLVDFLGRKSLVVYEVDKKSRRETRIVGDICLEFKTGTAALEFSKVLNLVLSITGKKIKDAPIAHMHIEPEIRGQGVGKYITRQGDRHYRAQQSQKDRQKREVRIVLTRQEIVRAFRSAGYEISNSPVGTVASKAIEGERFDLNKLHVIPVMDVKTGKERFFVTQVKEK